jgi:hypothetical protein
MTHSHLFDLPTDLIPPRLQEIASYCGQQTAIVLLLNFPGVRIHVPKRPLASHRLAELLGLAAFGRLCEMYADELIDIPRAAAAARALRNQAILRDFADGNSQSSIAIKYGLTQRQVNQICNAVPIRQLDIFDS